MAIYNFVRDGRSYTVSGPPGSTESQAAAVLDAQLLSGTLIGQEPGTSLSLEEQIRNGLNPESLDLPSSQPRVLTQLQSSVPENEIDLADIAQQPATESVGALTPSQVQGIMAQRAKDIQQSAVDVTNKGLGTYGLSAAQLERSGYLKPGTAQLVANAGNLQAILSSKEVWTNKNNIENLSALLGSRDTQSQIQKQIYNLDYQNLLSKGTITTALTPQNLAAVLNVSSQFGTKSATEWLQGQAISGLSPEIQTVARSAQYALNLTNSFVGGSVSPLQLTTGLTNAFAANLSPVAIAGIQSVGSILNQNSALSRGLANSLGTFSQDLKGSLSAGGDLFKFVSGSQLSQSISGTLSQFGQDLNSASASIGKLFNSLGGSNSLGNFFTGLGGGQLGGFNLGSLSGVGSQIAQDFGKFFTDLSAASRQFSAFAQQYPIVGTIFSGFLGGGSSFGGGINFTLKSTPQPLPAFQNTTNRSTLDAAVTRLIGDASVTGINYSSFLPNLRQPVPIDTGAIQAIRNTIGLIEAQAARQRAANVNQQNSG